MADESSRRMVDVQSEAPSHPRTWTVWCGRAVLGGLLLVVVYLFYLGGYRHLLVDESASFATELTMRILEANRSSRLLVIGNSTVAEGFRASTFNAASGAGAALNLGIGSAHFFRYEKLFSLSIEKGLRPQAVLIVLTPESLSLRPGYDEVLNDIGLMKTELKVNDYARLWHHSAGPLQYADYAARLAMRPALYTADLRDLVTHLRPRAAKIRVTYNWLKAAGRDPEALETDNRFAVCGVGPLRELEQVIARERSVAGSARLADLERVWAGYSSRVHQPLAVDVRQTRRLERVLASIASRVPRLYVTAAPYYDPDFDAYPAEYREAFSEALREAVARIPRTTLIPEFAADCSMFFDTVHLNHEGGEKFTAYLHEQIGSLN